jgi:acyl carrier protein phosphodiesterase
MNTLCHLCLELSESEFIMGQFLGDFSRGRVETLPYSENVKKGIRAHRRVDAAGEMHPFLKKAKALLPERDRRFGGILLDLYGDYLLHCCWEEIMDRTWGEAFSEIDTFLRSPPHSFPAGAARYAEFLVRQDLLEAYRDPQALPEIFDRVGQRFRKPVALSPLLCVLQEQEAQFIQDFPSYFADMKAESDQFFH